MGVSEWVTVAPGVRLDKSAPGVRLHVLRWFGSSDQPVRRTVVYVHGLSSNARLWEGVAPLVSAFGHPGWAVDLRSHGASPATESGYDTATAADDVAAVIEAAGAGPCIVVGQSWGGNIAIELAARHPSTVAGLALVDGGWFAPSTEFDSWAACEKALRPPDIDGQPAEDLRDRMRGWHPGWDDWALDATMANLRVDDDKVYRRLTIEHHMAIVRNMWDNPPAARYPLVKVPVVLMPALSEDPSEAAARLARVTSIAGGLADATVSPYEGGDHDLHAQRPAEVAADVLGLAARVDGTR